MGDVDTDLVEKVVARSIALHQAQCPSVKAVGEALRDLDKAQQQRHEAVMQQLREQEIRFVEGGFKFNEHDRRLGQVEAETETCKSGLGALKEARLHEQNSMLRTLVKVLLIFLAGSGVGAGTIQLINQLLGG